MSIVITKNGKNATIIDKTSFGLESKLQEYIYENPESVPLYEIKEDIRLFILAREFNTNSGPIDAVGIDGDGEIYLIETKLYTNTDKRKVVAQVLDYGAALWAHYRNPDDFLNELASHVTRNFDTTLRQEGQTFFGGSEEDTTQILEKVGQNVVDGNYRFVVLMDALDDRLKDLVLFINQNSEFTVYAVELEYYKHEEFEIIIPKLFGSEVKKESRSRVRPQIPTDEEFVAAYEGRPEQGKVKVLLSFFNQLISGEIEINKLNAKKTPKYLNFNFVFDSGYKVWLYVPFDPEADGGGGLQCWCSKEIENEVKRLIRNKFPNTELRDGLQTTFGKITRTPFSEYSTDKFKALLEDISRLES